MRNRLCPVQPTLLSTVAEVTHRTSDPCCFCAFPVAAVGILYCSPSFAKTCGGTWGHGHTHQCPSQTFFSADSVASKQSHLCIQHMSAREMGEREIVRTQNILQCHGSSLNKGADAFCDTIAVASVGLPQSFLSAREVGERGVIGTCTLDLTGEFLPRRKPRGGSSLQQS
jgi:hypothetical protein